MPVLARKPGAFNGAPFKDWVLPAAIERIRRKLASTDNGNRQMVDILTAVLTDGLPAVTACAKRSVAGSIPPMSCSISWPVNVNRPTGQHHAAGALTLRHAPIADCARYDNLRKIIGWNQPNLRPHG